MCSLTISVCLMRSLCVFSNMSTTSACPYSAAICNAFLPDCKNTQHIYHHVIITILITYILTISLLCMHVHYTPIGSLVGNWLLSVQFSSYIQSETFNTLRIHAASSLTKHLCNYVCMHTSHAIDTKPYSMLNAKLLYCNFKLD